MRRRLSLLSALFLLGAGTAVAQPAISDAQVRDVLAQQARAWNAGDVDAYFATFSADARFAQRARSREGEIVPYGESSLAEARAQARRFFAGAQAARSGQVLAVRISRNGRGAGAVTRETARIEADGRVRQVCSETVQGFRREGGRLVSTGVVETIVRCGR